MRAAEEAPEPHPDQRPWRHAGDGWVQCRCGSQHWGTYGAAGLLLVSAPAGAALDGRGPAVASGERAVVLQHRALWSHHGGSWGIPGGALAPGESALAGAQREAVEEAGVPEGTARPWCSVELTHPDWSYTTIVAEALRAFSPAATDAESLEVAWVAIRHVPDRELLPAFATAWPELTRLLGRRALVVVDGANVVGSRPDGWWRDRTGAARRLHAALAATLPGGMPATTLGLPAQRWWPDVVLVLEGQARAADVGEDSWPQASPTPSLAVVRAGGSGDDTIVRSAQRAHADGYTDVVIVSADRELGGRVAEAGASAVGPQGLLGVL